jgi:hypothetical protein
MLFKKEKSVWFTHIPRCAGRSIQHLFMNLNGYERILGTEKLYKGVEEMHMHLTYMKEFDEFNNNKKFAIVRNPIDRTISSMKADFHVNPHLDKESILNNSNVFRVYLEEAFIYRGTQSNWFRHQSDFLDKDTLIWKYEKGFGQSFHTFLKNKLNINLKNKKNIVIENIFYDKKMDILLSKEHLKIIKEYYKKDFKLLKYK